MEKRGVPVHCLISVVMGATLLDERELTRFAEMAIPKPRAVRPSCENHIST